MRFLPLLLVIVPLAFFLLAGTRRAARKLRIIQAQLAAYRKADYEAQLKIIEGLRGSGAEPHDYLFVRGAACYQLGRLDEAERALRRGLSLETNPSLRTVCRDELGRVLMAQQRWDEAEACFRECIAEAPQRSGGHRALAEMLLRRGGDSTATLEPAQSAVAADRGVTARRSALGKEDNAINLSESLAILAWALAANQADRHEIESTLDEAFRLCGVTTKPVLAELHYTAGRAQLALGNAGESRRQFACAAEIDPAGTYGRLSQSALPTADLPA